MPTILCVDDDRSYCRLIARALRDEGYEVEVAHDGETALELHRRVRPDLILLDVLLPQRDGFSTLEVLRAEDGRHPVAVFLLSGCSFGPAYGRRAEELAADAVLTKPVPLDRLLDLVAKQVGPSERRRSASSPPLAGRLEDVPFPRLLHHLHGMRATGVLELRQGRKRKQLQLRDGQPVAIRSNLVNETLGHLLVASGTISWDALHESIRRMSQGEGLQGQILMAMHMLDETDLARALTNQAEEKLFETFAWRRGSFRFHRDARLRTGNVLALKRAMSDVILEGVRTRFPLSAVDELLDAHRGDRPAPGETPFYRFQSLQADAPVRALLERLDQVPTLGALFPLSESERRTLFALLVLERIDLRTADEAPRASDRAHGGADVGDAAPAAAPPAERAAEPAGRAEGDGGPRPAAPRRPGRAAATRRPGRVAATRPASDRARVRRGAGSAARPATRSPGARTRPATADRTPAGPAARKTSRPTDRTPPAALEREAPRPTSATDRGGAERPAPEPVASAAQEEVLRSDLARLAERFRQADCFGILGVRRDSDDEDVRSAYARLAKRSHPDRFASSSEAVRELAEDVFRRVSRAYDALRTRERRLAYLRESVSREREQAELDEGHRALQAELEFQKGEATLRARRYPEAVGHFERAVAAYPEEGEYRCWLGWAHWLSAPEAPGRLEEAIRHVKAGLKLAPDREKPYLFLGRLLKAADRPKQAEKMFARAVQLDADCVEALRELRLIHLRRERSKGLVRRILRR